MKKRGFSSHPQPAIVKIRPVWTKPLKPMKEDTIDPHYKGISIYTDGSLRPGNFGAYAWIMVIDDEIRDRRVYKVYNTTINKMELSAILDALKSFKDRTELVIYTDSQYAKNAIVYWSKSWRKNNWLTSAGEPVKNKDLLEQILELNKHHRVTYKWIRGHASSKYNLVVDQLVQQATREMVDAAQS